MLKALFRSSVAWTVVGLAGGLAYREITRQADYTGYTQLAVVHTHALTLGTVFLLGVMALDRVFGLGGDKRFRVFVLVWNIGLAITVGMQAVKGVLQVQGASFADSPAIAGISGLGHMSLTAGFILLLLALGRRVKAVDAERRAAAELRTGEEATAQ